MSLRNTAASSPRCCRIAAPRSRRRRNRDANHCDVRLPVLDHLVTMTDDVGMFQHARFDIPNRSFGYCTDDVARALIVAIEATRDRATEQIGAKLVSTYLAFLFDAQIARRLVSTTSWATIAAGKIIAARTTRSAALCGASDTASHVRTRCAGSALRANSFGAALSHIENLDHLRSRAYCALGLAAVALAEPSP